MKTNLPKISVITPTLNQGQYLEETILSVINQNYPDLEYIVIDGGSTDNTKKILERYANRITSWISEPDSGQGHAINKGLSLATGKVFNWLNSDDVMPPGTLAEVGKMFSEDDCKLVCGFTTFFNDSLEIEMSSYRLWIADSTEETFTNNVYNQPGTFFLLDRLIELGGVNQRMHFAFDLELWLRYLARFGIQGIRLSDSCFCKFRMHDQSKTVQQTDFFNVEINGLRLFLAHTLHAPEFYKTYLMGRIQKTSVHQPSIWFFNPSFSRRALWTHTLTKHLYEAYYGKRRRQCRIELVKSISGGYVRLTWPLLKLLVKLFFLPISFKKHRRNKYI
ncbi:MAG TPA: glycosyltransferase family 2 protein [Bacteroidales bacterium]|nr:glycosyltransferase family 2 protein [Bacteroidales bacterium]HSA43413.1 glycosyltransferase family 2 protein [Bacteroidales bacterium]